LHVRLKLARYESNKKFKSNLNKLKKAINKSTIDDLSPIQKYIDEIKYILAPKKITSKKEMPANVYINQKVLSQYNVEEFNIFIDCPIEIHLISILWILEVGHLLDNELKSNVHGYRLVRNADGNIEDNSYKLFEKYHEKYMNFRDGALQKAIRLHEEDLDTTIINLDIKAFFYNINFNFEKDCEEYSTNEYIKKLNKIMDVIHDKYKKNLEENKIKTANECKTIIPIGLLSSSIISNYVLKDFDEQMLKDVKPAFYSRYVDDMLLVLSNTKLKEKKTVSKLLKSCLFKKANFTFKNKNIHFTVNKNKFLFQNKKVKIFHFLKSDSSHLLEMFSHTITKNSSLFKLLPEDKEIFNTLGEASYNISYSSTVNKISSINGNSLDILNIKRNISQMTKIVTSTSFSRDEITKYNKQINELFVGQNILELQTSWEKVFTYLFVSNSKKEFIELAQRVIKIISKIKYKKNKDIEDNMKMSVLIYFLNSISLSISLYPDIFKEQFLSKLNNIYTKNINTKILQHFSLKYIIPNANHLRNSNLIRHYMISSVPLLNYCNLKKSNSLVCKKIDLDNFDFTIDDIKIKYSPRFIHYHEISIFYHLKFLHGKMENNEKKEYINNQENFIYNKYNVFNKTAQSKSDYPQKVRTRKRDKYHHHIKTRDKKNKLNIALVNIKINVSNSISSFEGQPNLTFDRLLEIFKILNTAKNNNIDIIVFPEISMPYTWLKTIADFSKLNDIAVIFGMEHFSIKKTVYNFSVAILPFQVNGYTNSFIHFNLKSHYSPSEIIEIEGRKYNIPEESKNTTIDIYHWKNTVFSIFNCYELTNISARGKLVGENDFTIAIEYNSDTNYFSNIIGSIARDNHAYFIQVNSSQYGDSRITQPTSTETMDIVKIKGGKHTSLIAGEIDIKKLRTFQHKTHSLQMIEQERNKYNSFKLTPPNFKVSKYRK